MQLRWLPEAKADIQRLYDILITAVINELGVVSRG